MYCLVASDALLHAPHESYLPVGTGTVQPHKNVLKQGEERSNLIGLMITVTRHRDNGWSQYSCRQSCTCSLSLSTTIFIRSMLAQYRTPPAKIYSTGAADSYHRTTVTVHSFGYSMSLQFSLHLRCAIDLHVDLHVLRPSNFAR